MQALIDLLFIRDLNSYEMVAYMSKNEKTIILFEQPHWNVIFSHMISKIIKMRQNSSLHYLSHTHT